MKVIADIEGRVFAYRDGALLIIVRGKETSPFGPAYESVRGELDGRCHTLGYRGLEVAPEGAPAWAKGSEVSVYKIWEACPTYEHECAVMACVAS